MFIVYEWKNKYLPLSIDIYKRISRKKGKQKKGIFSLEVEKNLHILSIFTLGKKAEWI
jgi:hypothetical protein